MEKIKYCLKVKTTDIKEGEIKKIFNTLKNNCKNEPITLYEVFNQKIVKIFYDIDFYVSNKDSFDLNDEIDKLTTFNNSIFGNDCEYVFSYDYKESYKINGNKKEKLKKKLSIHYVVWNKTIEIDLLKFIIGNKKNDENTPNGMDNSVYRTGVNKFRLSYTNKEKSMEIRKNKGYLKPNDTSFNYFKKLCISNITDIKQFKNDEWEKRFLESKKTKQKQKKKRNNFVEKTDVDFKYVGSDKRKNVIDLIMKGFSKDFFDDYETIKPLMVILTNEGFSVEEISNYINENIDNQDSKYINNIDQIRSFKNKNYNYNFGTLIYFIKTDNIEYFENNCLLKFNNLLKEEDEIETKTILGMLSDKYLKIVGGNENNLKVFNSKYYEFIRNRLFYKIINDHLNKDDDDTSDQDQDEDSFKVGVSNYDILTKYVKKHFIRLRFETDYLVRGYDDEEINRILWKIKKTLNNDDLSFNTIEYIGTKEEVIGFYNPLKHSKMTYNGLTVIYKIESLWGKLKKDIRFNTFNDYSYKPVGIYEEYDFINNTTFNTFGGFGYKDYSSVDVNENDKIDMTLFLEYIFKCICMSRFDIFKYFLMWLSDIIKNPRNKNGICFIFYSKEKGTGKGLFGKFLMKILSDDNCLFSDITKLMGRFSNNGDKTILSIFDELNRESFSKKNYNKLKNLITETKMEKEKKGVDVIKSFDYNKFILLTNELDFLKTDTDENRFCILNFLKLNDVEFSKYKPMLERVYKDKVFLKMFGKIIEDFDISKMKGRDDWTKIRPVSKLDQLVKTMDIVEEYLRDILKRLVKNCIYDFEISKNKKTLKIFKNSLYMNFLSYWNSKNNGEGKSFSEGTFIKIFNGIVVKYMTVETKTRREIINLNIKKMVKDFVSRFIIEKDDFDEEDFYSFIQGEETTENEKKQKKKELSKVKRNNKKIIIEENKQEKEEELKEENSKKLFNDFVNNLYGNKTKLDQKVIIEEITDTEITDEYGEQVFCFDECLL